MKATKLNSPPKDTRIEWRRLNDLIDDVEQVGGNITSSHPQLLTLTRNEGGLVLDCAGLVDALRNRGITL